MSKPYTVEEARTKFLKHWKNVAKYWAELPNKTPHERCYGLCFSLLVTFDGGSCGMPAFDIYPADISPEDLEYYKKNNETYFNPDEVLNNCQMHERWSAIERGTV